MYLNIIKAAYDKLTADIILIGDRLKTFPLDIQVPILYMKRCSTSLIILYVHVKIAQLCLTLCNPMDCSLPGSSVHGIFPGKNARMDCHLLLQGIFPTQGLNPGLPHCRQTLSQLSHKGSLRILERVAYPFSSGFSWPRKAGVSCIAGGFFTNWAIREAQINGVLNYLAFFKIGIVSYSKL